MCGIVGLVYSDPARRCEAELVTAMRDMGYVVNDAVADPYSLPAFLLRLGATEKFRLNEVPLEGPFYGINRQGRIERVIFR